MSLSSQTLRVSLAAAALAVSPLTQAQPGAPASVVVTAARTSQPIVDALPHTTVLGRDDIERSQAIDLAMLLAAEAGVQLAANGGRGTPTTLFIRGAPTRQVLVLVDGVPLSRQDATGQVGIEHLMLDQVERVEIVRGNVSALYGSGAAGGVVQVFTRRGVGDPSVSLRAEAGARGFGLLAAHAAGRAGATHWSLGLSGQRDRGQSAIDPIQVPAANPDRDGYRNRSANLQLTQTVADGHALTFGLVHADGRLDYDSAFGAPADLQRSRTRKDLFRLSSDNRWSAAWTSHLSLMRQIDDAHFEETGAFGFIGDFRTRVDALSWANDYALDERTTLLGGVELARQRIVADDGFGGAYDRSRDVSALYGGVTTRLGPHSLALNLRHDRVGGVASRSSGRLGWGWQFAAQWKALASVGDAFSAPPLGYLYAPFFGNALLRPELARSVELGLQWATSAHRVRATAFRTTVRDELDFDPQTFTFANLARTRNHGLELSYAGRIGATDLRASLTAQRPIDAISGQRRLRRSDQLASMSLSHDFGQGLRGGLSARHAGARPEVGSTTLAAYTVVDLTAQWQLNRQTQWFGRIENVGDVRYQTAAGYDQPRRGVFVGLRVNGNW